METIYDWITLALFAAIVVLFLHRSLGSDAPQDTSKDPLYHYLAVSIGCAVTNYLGNEEMHVPAIAALVATLAYAFYFLKPIPFR